MLGFSEFLVLEGTVVMTKWKAHNPDIITALAGNDEITSRDGDDVVYGNDGDDILQEGGGNDRIYGDGRNDTLLLVELEDKIAETRETGEEQIVKRKESLSNNSLSFYITVSKPILLTKKVYGFPLHKVTRQC